MIEALTAGQEISETILNYRRDGSPFINLLMIAPLYDNKGHVRYFLGCQIDVSSLVEGGRGIESFAQLVAKDRSESRLGGRPEKDPKHMLGELSQMFNKEESDIVQNRARRYSEESNRSIPEPRSSVRGRRILGMEDTQTERSLWPHASLGPSGRLPGVYQNVSIFCVLSGRATDSIVVPPRPPISLSTHHIYLSSVAHTWLAADQIPRSRRRTSTRPRRHSGCPLPRPRRDSQDLMAHQLRLRLCW